MDIKFAADWLTHMFILFILSTLRAPYVFSSALDTHPAQPCPSAGQPIYSPDHTAAY